METNTTNLEDTKKNDSVPPIIFSSKKDEKKVPQLQSDQDYSITCNTKDVKITFTKSVPSFKITIVSDEIFLESISPETSHYFYELYANPEVMRTFHYGKTKTKSEVDEYLELWHRAFNNLSPFGAFAAFLVKPSKNEKEFIGNISPDHRGDDPGKAELTYLLLPSYQGQGFARRMAHLILDEYIPASIAIGCNLHLRGKEFYEVIATSRVDNEASMRILKRLMSEVPDSTIEMYGAKRTSFNVSKEELINRFSKLLVSWEYHNSKNKLVFDN